jgi:hypothetical protein
LRENLFLLVIADEKKEEKEQLRMKRRVGIAEE